MALSTVCPRCRGSIQRDDVACPRCGLPLPGHGSEPAGLALTPPAGKPLNSTSDGDNTDPSGGTTFQPESETQRLDYFPANDLTSLDEDVLPFDPASATLPDLYPQSGAFDAEHAAPLTTSSTIWVDDAGDTHPGQPTDWVTPARGSGPLASPRPYTGPIESAPPAHDSSALLRTGSLSTGAPPLATGSMTYTGPLVYTGPLTSTSALAPQGALQLLPQEAIAYQMGALYLTNKRVILLAPTVVRSAFIRDIDAVGTLTERASTMNLFFGGLSVLLAVGAIWANGNKATVQPIFGPLYALPALPLILASALAVLGVFLLAKHFFWVKRSLFVSVKGRPLITVSMTDWNSRRLSGMDAFVNAFFQIKDYLTGDLVERHMTGELSERSFTGGL